MAATVQIDETNGTAPGVVTNNIANTNYGAVDAAALDPVANPIIPASNSFQKWQQFNVTALGGSVSVRNLKHFASAPAANATHKFNGNTVQGSYDTSRKTIYETPDQTDGDAPNTAPTGAPGSANIGIGGQLTGEITSPGTSDFVVSIITTTGAAIAGTTLTVTFRYDEVA